MNEEEAHRLVSITKGLVPVISVIIVLCYVSYFGEPETIKTQKNTSTTPLVQKVSGVIEAPIIKTPSVSKNKFKKPLRGKSDASLAEERDLWASRGYGPEHEAYREYDNGALELLAQSSDMLAHQVLGENHYNSGNYGQAYEHLFKAISMGSTFSIDKMALIYLDGYDIQVKKENFSEANSALMEAATWMLFGVLRGDESYMYFFEQQVIFFDFSEDEISQMKARAKIMHTAFNNYRTNELNLDKFNDTKLVRN